jgi:hypothetical protein
MDTHQLIFAAAMILATHAEAATLAADALVCESEADLQFVEDDKQMVGKPASQALREAATMQKFNALRQETSRIAPNLVSRREADEAAKMEAQYKRIQTVCASSGASTLTATVIEQRPISGTAKVQLPFRGTQAQLWTSGRNVTN